MSPSSPLKDHSNEPEGPAEAQGAGSAPPIQEVQSTDDLSNPEPEAVDPNPQDSSFAKSELNSDQQPTELVFATVGAIGTDHEKVRRMIADRLELYNYDSVQIRISKDIIGEHSSSEIPKKSGYARAMALIDAGNDLCKAAQDDSFLALAAVAKIRAKRQSGDGETERKSYIISSLKRPKEVKILRKIYGKGMFVFAIHKSEPKRLEHLHQGGVMTKGEATRLIRRDEKEPQKHGQQLQDTYHRSDFFVVDDGREDKLRYSINRCIDLIFGKPTLTPTFNEYAMHLAFASALRSGDLSRQVGAVVARDKQILATGSNDCPAFGGGLYWPALNDEGEIIDVPDGRDFMRRTIVDKEEIVGFDSNEFEKNAIIKSVLMDLKKLRQISKEWSQEDLEDIKTTLENSQIRGITEYGRVVHAEMEALLSCARNGTSCQDATLFCTTFPCHNCAKHIVAAGLSEVVFVEPYAKSRALSFHTDSIVLDEKKQNCVRFKHFIGVGPRRFFDLFSMTGGSGAPIVRKDSEGRLIKWQPRSAETRFKMYPLHYRGWEQLAEERVKDVVEKSKYGDAS